MNSFVLYLVDNCLLSRVSSDIYFSKNPHFSYKIFDNADDCLEELKNNPAEIIISDIDLPGTNGIEEAKIVKNNYPETKVIMYTSREDSSSVLASLSNGVCAYVIKRKRKKLKNIIDRILQNEFCMDLRMAQKIFSKIPYSNITNPDSLNENQKIKDCLTEREIEVLKLLIDGKTNTQIANEIVISTNTAKAHVGSIFNKLSVTDRVQAAVKAIKANIL